MSVQQRLHQLQRDYVTVPEATEKLELDSSTSGRVFQLIKAGVFPGAVKWMGKWLIPRVEVERRAASKPRAGRPSLEKKSKKNSSPT